MTADAIGPGTVVHVEPAVVSVDVDGELVVLDERTGDLHLLDPMGSLVFRCLGSGTLGEIAADFVEEVGGDPDAVLADVVALVRDLRTRGLVGFGEP